MKRPRQAESTSGHWAQQATALLIVKALLLLVASAARGQDLPFTVTRVEFTEKALERQRDAFRAEGHQHEVLFCVDAWRLEPEAGGYQKIVITRTRRAEAGEKYRIADVGPKCRDASGRAQPTIHTHPDQHCQMSRPDLIAISTRRAAFDGIQCGDSYFVWAFAWQINAMATWVQLSRLRGIPANAPHDTPQPSTR